MSIYQRKTKEEVAILLQKEISGRNVMAIPKIVKIVVNAGMAEALKDKKIMDEMVLQISKIAGQKPVITRAKTAIAGFKLRKGDAIGVMLTLRGVRMYDFFEKLVSVVFPRVRDFRGVSTTSFDGNGNFTVGFPEMSVFPEVDVVSPSAQSGLEVTIVTSSKTNEEAKKLLEFWGMPFKKS